MAAPIITVDPQHPQPRHVARAVSALQAGGLIAYPTDTYYGIGCDLFSKRAIERLYRLKGRERNKPFSFLCPDLGYGSGCQHLSTQGFRVLKPAPVPI